MIKRAKSLYSFSSGHLHLTPVAAYLLNVYTRFVEAFGCNFGIWRQELILIGLIGVKGGASLGVVHR